VKAPGILDRDRHFDPRFGIGEFVALDDVKLVCMGCAVIVDKSLGVEADGIHHQRIAVS